MLKEDMPYLGMIRGEGKLHGSYENLEPPPPLINCRFRDREMPQVEIFPKSTKTKTLNCQKNRKSNFSAGFQLRGAAPVSAGCLSQSWGDSLKRYRMYV